MLYHPLSDQDLEETQESYLPCDLDTYLYFVQHDKVSREERVGLDIGSATVLSIIFILRKFL